jgi:hypothetical protein
MCAKLSSWFSTDPCCCRTEAETVFFLHAKYKALHCHACGDTLANPLAVTALGVVADNGTAMSHSRDTHVQKWHPCNPRGPQRCAQDGGIVQTVFFQQLRVDAPGFVVLVGPILSFGGQCHWQYAVTTDLTARTWRLLAHTVIYMVTASQALTLLCHAMRAARPNRPGNNVHSTHSRTAYRSTPGPCFCINVRKMQACLSCAAQHTTYGALRLPAHAVSYAAPTGTYCVCFCVCVCVCVCVGACRPRRGWNVQTHWCQWCAVRLVSTAQTRPAHLCNCHTTAPRHRRRRTNKANTTSVCPREREHAKCLERYKHVKTTKNFWNGGIFSMHTHACCQTCTSIHIAN